MEKIRLLAPDSEVHIRGVISVSPGSCLFPYIDKR